MIWKKGVEKKFLEIRHITKNKKFIYQWGNGIKEGLNDMQMLFGKPRNLKQDNL